MRLLSLLLLTGALAALPARPCDAQLRQGVLLPTESSLAGPSPLAAPGPHRLPLAAGDTTRPASDWRKAAQVVGGFLGASVAGLAGWKLLDDPYGPDRRVKGDAGYTPAANTAYAAASFVGCTLLVYAIGRTDGSRGSLLSTAIGSGIASLPLLLGRNEPYLPILGVAFIAPLQALGGTVGYQRSHRAPAR